MAIERQFARIPIGTVTGATFTRTLFDVPAGCTGMDIKARVTARAPGTYDDSDYWGVALKSKTANKTLSSCVFGAVPGSSNITLAAGVPSELPITYHWVPSGDTLEITFTKNGSAADIVDVLMTIEGTPF